MSWENGDARIYVDLSASTGVIQQYSRYVEKPDSVSANPLDEEAALQVAVRFLERVTSPEERAKLSEANEYADSLMYFGGLQDHSFTFTRVENGLPFLENGFEITLDKQGEVQSFWRRWYDGELPAPNDVISKEEAEKLLSQEMAPSLLYRSRPGMYADSSDRYANRLVYRFDTLDPQFVNAADGTVINALGEPAEARKIEPLGRTVSDPGERKTITQDEAQRIADQVVKKLPGTYRSEGSRGGGGSSGPDGIERKYWSFEYTPLHESKESAQPLEIAIGDRGELVEYRRYANRFGNSGPITGEVVSWEQAEKSAVELVKQLLDDRLGEIYLTGTKPDEKLIQQELNRGSSYSISFGWLHQGVPVEHANFRVEVDPKTGEALELRIFPEDLNPITGDPTTVVDLEEARQAIVAEQTLMLTYYQPQPAMYFPMNATGEPLLVYRYAGDSGFVDASTGEWISEAQILESSKPQDIADHPQKEALELAVRYGLLQVTDGKLEPEKQVTRGEMAQILSRLSDRPEFHRHFFFDDEEEEPFTFADVDEQHPLFGVIQKNLREGYIEKAGRHFEPDKPVTRAQAAEMLARLLGYKDLLDNAEIFQSPFTDLQSDQVAAVSILHGEGIFPGKTADRFEPDGTLTRAELAHVLQALFAYAQKR
jgi:hypothetical protein